METNDLAEIYAEIARIAGIDVAISLHDHFKGQQILFPQKLYNKNYIYSYIKQNYNGRNVRELSQKFGLSDRRIRQILNEK